MRLSMASLSSSPRGVGLSIRSGGGLCGWLQSNVAGRRSFGFMTPIGGWFGSAKKGRNADLGIFLRGGLKQRPGSGSPVLGGLAGLFFGRIGDLRPVGVLPGRPPRNNALYAFLGLGLGYPRPARALCSSHLAFSGSCHPIPSAYPLKVWYRIPQAARICRIRRHCSRLGIWNP